jgi:DNA-binding LytR/AlgR family response regulator
MQIIIQNEAEEHLMQELLMLLGTQIPDLLIQSHNGLPNEGNKNNNQFDIVPPCFFVKNKDRYEKIAIGDILWVESNGGSVKIVAETGEVMGSLKLSSFLNQIQHSSLLRIHKSYVVNICKLTAFDSGVVYINYKGKEKMLAIGSTYRKEFKKQMPLLLSD